MELLISEEMLLLALDNEKGGTTWLSGWAALTGGALLDALAAGAVTLDDEERLRPGPQDEPEHPLPRRVRAAVAAHEEQPRTLADWVQHLPVEVDPFLEVVTERLVGAGVLTEEHGTVLGIFPTTRFPEADPGPERALRARLHAVLVEGVEPEPHDLQLVALVQPTGLLAMVVEDEDRIVRRLARRRAVELAERAVEHSDAPVKAVLGAVAAHAAATIPSP